MSLCSHRLCRRSFLLGTLVLPPLTAQDVVLDRYYVSAAPPAGGPAARVTPTEFRTYLPIDVGAVLARESSSIAAIRRAGVASDVLLRGLGRDNVAVQLDGAPAHAACPGRMDPPVFHVSTPLVERVVVFTGPFDVRTGAAPGGAIQVQSAEAPSTALVTAGALVGANRLFSADFAAGGPLGGGWRGLLGGSYQQGDTYRDGTGRRVTELPGMNFRPEARDGRAFQIGHAEMHALWKGGAGTTLTLRASGNDARDVLYPALQMDALRDRATRLAASFSSSAPRAFADRWQLQWHHHRVEHDMSDARRTSSLGMWGARGYMMRTIAATTGYGMSAEAELSRPFADFVYGGELTSRNWVADNVVGANTNAMLPDATTRQASAFVQAERRDDAWRWKLGARVDAWRSSAARDIGFVQRAHGMTRNARTDAAPSGFLLGERSAGDRVALFAGLGQGARIPDPQERYISVDRPGTGTDWVGNPQLGVVRATEVAAGARVSAGPARVALRAFHSRLDNFVLLRRLTPASGSTANPARTESYAGIDAELTGAELSGDIAWSENWSARVGVAGQRGTKRQIGVVGESRDLPEIPPWQGRAVLRWQQSRLRIESEAQWALRQTHLDFGVGERPLPGYGVLHARAEYGFARHVSASCGVDNIFDRTYAAHNAYTRDPFAAGLVLNEPGRFAYVRLHWKL